MYTYSDDTYTPNKLEAYDSHIVLRYTVRVIAINEVVYILLQLITNN